MGLWIDLGMNFCSVLVFSLDIFFSQLSEKID